MASFLSNVFFLPFPYRCEIFVEGGFQEWIQSVVGWVGLGRSPYRLFTTPAWRFVGLSVTHNVKVGSRVCQTPLRPAAASGGFSLGRCIRIHPSFIMSLPSSSCGRNMLQQPVFRVNKRWVQSQDSGQRGSFGGLIGQLFGN